MSAALSMKIVQISQIPTGFNQIQFQIGIQFPHFSVEFTNKMNRNNFRYSIKKLSLRGKPSISGEDNSRNVESQISQNIKNIC